MDAAPAPDVCHHQGHCKAVPTPWGGAKVLEAEVAQADVMERKQGRLTSMEADSLSYSLTKTGCFMFHETLQEGLEKGNKISRKRAYPMCN